MRSKIQSIIPLKASGKITQLCFPRRCWTHGWALDNVPVTFPRILSGSLCNLNLQIHGEVYQCFEAPRGLTVFQLQEKKSVLQNGYAFLTSRRNQLYLQL